MLQGVLAMAKSGRLELGDNIYGHYRSIFNHFVTIHAFDRRTDRWTDRILIARLHLNSMQRGKK